MLLLPTPAFLITFSSSTTALEHLRRSQTCRCTFLSHLHQTHKTFYIVSVWTVWKPLPTALFWKATQPRSCYCILTECCWRLQWVENSQCSVLSSMCEEPFCSLWVVQYIRSRSRHRLWQTLWCCWRSKSRTHGSGDGHRYPKQKNFLSSQQHAHSWILQWAR